MNRQQNTAEEATTHDVHVVTPLLLCDDAANRHYVDIVGNPDAGPFHR